MFVHLSSSSNIVKVAHGLSCDYAIVFQIIIIGVRVVYGVRESLAETQNEDWIQLKVVVLWNIPVCTVETDMIWETTNYRFPVFAYAELH